MANYKGTPENLKPFKKGQNSKRGKSGKQLKTILQELLDEDFTSRDPFTKEKAKRPLKEWLNIVLIKVALVDEDVRALSMIYDRIDGKVTDNINMAVEDSVAMKLIRQKVRLKLEQEETKIEVKKSKKSKINKVKTKTAKARKTSKKK